MIRLWSRCFAVGACLLAGWGLVVAEPQPSLTDYRTAATATAAPIRSPSALQVGQTGYLGVTVLRDARGSLMVDEVQPGSPAATAGLKNGDVVTRVGEHAVKTVAAFRQWVQTYGPDETVKFSLIRQNNALEVSAKLAATSRPMKLGAPRVTLGVELGEPKEGQGVKIERVFPGSAAASCGIKNGEYICKIEGHDVTNAGRLSALLADRKPGDQVTLLIHREGKDVELKATLSAERGFGGGGRFGGREGPPPAALWKHDLLRVAVVCLEFPDVKHNAKVANKDWADAFFSTKTYTDKKNATDQPVFGSLNDYFQEQSCGAFRLQGKVLDWVEVGKKRGEYIQGSGTSNKTALLVEALEKLTAREGKDALKDFDALLFIYAGDRVYTNRGAVYYPHAGTLSFQNKRIPYALGCEGGSRMTAVGGFVKELSQVLGLPDLAARPENPGSEGLGEWCVLSNPKTDGRPQHLSAWAKEKIGWIKPTVIDPTVKQKLILAPIEDAPRECFKVLVRPDGSEYFLLENRRKKGFDSALPAEGLLIWRVVNDRPILEESHGVEGPTGPLVHLAEAPYPSPANNAFTPDTIPSSRSPHGGGLPVYVTEIRRLPDGRVAFQIGYEYR